MQFLHRFVRRLAFLPVPRRKVLCSLCGRSYDEAKPFVKGPQSALICGQCAESALRIITEERLRPGSSNTDPIPKSNRLNFSVRDLLWLTLVAALIAGWLLDHRRFTRENNRYNFIEYKTGEQIILDNATDQAWIRKGDNWLDVSEF